MKKNIFIYVALLISSFELLGQSYDHSFTKTQRIKSPTNNILDIEQFGITKKNTSIVYKDALGRHLQAVGKQASPNQKDVVKFWKYDAAGRIGKDYSSYVDNTYDGSYKSSYLNNQASFYANEMGVAHTIRPYRQTIFESSPLSRVIEQGSVGWYWQPENYTEQGHTKKIDYGLNQNNSVLKFTVSSSGNLVCNASDMYYDSDKLYYTEITDEDEGKIRIYSDTYGRTLLKISLDYDGPQDLYTYSVYDILGRLRYIVTPLLANEIATVGSANLGWSDNDIKNLGYAFNYDIQGRLSEKLVPGADPVWYVYDNYDRIILEQDGNLRVDGKWKFVKYDNISRPIMSGIVTNTIGQTRDQVQTTVDNFYLTGDINFERTDFQNPNSIQGYTNVAYPVINQYSHVYTVSYYDDYQFDASNIVKFDATLSDEEKLESPKGLLTGNKIVVLDGTNTYLLSAQYYNNKYQIIQTCEQNNLGGSDKQSFNYEFDGKVVSRNHEHKTTQSGTIVEYREYTYDHLGRVKALDYWVDDAENAYRMYSNTYNELGQLVEKNIMERELPEEGTASLQSIDYKYNVRGWLKNINNSNINNENTTIDFNEILAPDEFIAGIKVDTIIFEVVGYDDGSKSLKPSLTINIEDKKDLIISKINDTSFIRYYEIDEIESALLYKSTVDSVIFAKLYAELSNPYEFKMAGLEFDQYDSKQMISGFIETQIAEKFLTLNNSDTLLAGILANQISKRSFKWTALVLFNEDSDDIFGMDIKYNEGLVELNGEKRYNGLISGVKFQAAHYSGIRGFGYSYDAHNQFTGANYGELDEGNWVANDNYTVSGISYDINGNIKSLVRRGKVEEQNGVPIFGVIDDLDYTYPIKSNQLINVDDQSGFTDAVIKSFEDHGSLLQVEFTYDANGNMIKDLNKGITSISYNVFNKPEEVEYSDERKLKFTYDGTGNKLGYTVYDAIQSVIKNNDYVANFVYNTEGLQFFQTEEGRMVPLGSHEYEPQFFFKDYLGNIREVYKKDSNGDVEIIEEHHYYPFGMQISGLDFISNPKNNYLYQGKEFFEDFDFDLHYFGARMFDSELGRWHSIDPVIAYASPYNGMGNNPISMVDPTGMAPGGWASEYECIDTYTGYGPYEARGGDFNIASTLPPGIIMPGGGSVNTGTPGGGFGPSGLPPAGSDIETGNGVTNPNGGKGSGGGNGGSSSGDNGDYSGGYTTKEEAFYNEYAKKTDAYNSLIEGTNGGKIASSEGWLPSINGQTAPWSNETIEAKYDQIMKYLDGTNQSVGFAVSLAGLAVDDIKFLNSIGVYTFYAGIGIAALRTDWNSTQSVTEFGIGSVLSVAAYFYPFAIPFAGAYSVVSIDKEYSKTLPERAREGYKMSKSQYRNHPYFKNLD